MPRKNRSNGATVAAKVHIIVLPKDKDCKGSVRYMTPDGQKAVVTNLYVSREAWESMPNGVEITLRPL